MNIYTGFIVGLVVVGAVIFIFFVIANLLEEKNGKKNVKEMKNTAKELPKEEFIDCQQREEELMSQQRREEFMVQQQQRRNDTSSQPPKTLHKKELVLRTLHAIGCNPSINDEDENMIEFEYQGGRFSIIAFDTSAFAYLFFVWWYNSPLDNIDALSAIQKAVNKANCRYIGCNVMYTFKQDENLVGVHSRSQLLFTPEVPHLDDYLVSKLQEMFRVRNDVVHDIQNELQ